MKRLVYWKNYYRNFFKFYLKSYLRLNNIENTKSSYLDLGILNSSIGSSNLGDLIIFESVYKHLRGIFCDDFFTNYPAQLHISHDAKYLMSQKKLHFISGTNLLSSNLESKFQWKIDSSHRMFLRNKVVLVGVGWWQYQGKVNSYTSRIYNAVLNKELMHSVRDDYSVEKLNSIGINNVVNTSCPTLWDITPAQCRNIPTHKGQNVVTTLTYYKQNKIYDAKMLEILGENYDTVYLWLQGYNDFKYLDEIKPGIKNVEIIPPTLEAYDALLDKGGIDYIGTRLHAGIRAIQKNIRTLILAVDNRALEVGDGINLNVIKREKVEDIIFFINGDYETNIKVPYENIELFKKSLLKFRNENTQLI